MVPRSAPVREQTMTVAAVVLLVLNAAASADAESNIVAGLGDLDDLAPPPGSKWYDPGSKWYDVLEETNEALSDAAQSWTDSRWSPTVELHENNHQCTSS